MKGSSVGKQQKVSPSTELSSLPPEEVARAMAETIMVEKILRNVRARPTEPVVSETSVREGQAIMAKMRLDSQAALLSRIDTGELITRDVLVMRLGGKNRWVNDSLNAGRIFSLQAPSGVDYFPSFFADSMYNRRALGRVSKVLARLPGPSKYFFFTNMWLTLEMTPLQALADGRVKDVLICAAAFAEK